MQVPDSHTGVVLSRFCMLAYLLLVSRKFPLNSHLSVWVDMSSSLLILSGRKGKDGDAGFDSLLNCF